MYWPSFNAALSNGMAR
jgi:ammonium transporter Rh